jgi:hypothetical protein
MPSRIVIRSLTNCQGNFHFDPARFSRAALALCRELCAFFAAEAQQFAFAAQLEQLSY